MPRSISRFRRAIPMLAVALLPLTAAACGARGAAAGTAGGPGIQVEVSNNLVPALTVSISAAVEGVPPVRLGTLVGGAAQTFTYRPSLTAGSFRLVADRPGPGGQLVSEAIPLPADGVGHIEWQLSTNNIIVH